MLSRILYGGRISLLIGLGAAVFSIGIGLVIGLVSGFFKWIDAVMMRVMDGLMAIPSILLAIAVVSLSGASLTTVLVAITIPEIPRVARLVRSVVLSAREEPYVEAAISVGSSLPKIMWRHLMPNTIAPLIVQGTYVCASAILTEAILSFLGAGISPETPTWGNIMAEGRAYFQIKPSADLLAGPAAVDRDPFRQPDRRRRARRARSPHEAAGGRKVTATDFHSLRSFRGDAEHRTTMCNCTSENIEIPGLVLTHHPGMTVERTSMTTPVLDIQNLVVGLGKDPKAARASSTASRCRCASARRCAWSARADRASP